MLTFIVMKDKLLSGEKTQTIRFKSRWEVDDKLDIWWGNPIFKDKSVKKLGIGKVISIEQKYGSELTKKDVLNDGFTMLKDLLNGLMVIYKMSRKEVIEHRWAILKWGWVEKYWEEK